jgi:hypothetical protein
VRSMAPLAIFALAALVWSGLSYQPDKGDAPADKTPPPPAKATGIFPNANVITFSGPAFGSKTITLEGLPVGTTEWMKNAPTGGPPAAATAPPEMSPFFEGRTNDRLKALEAQQAQILQVVLDLQKQLKASQPK